VIKYSDPSIFGMTMVIRQISISKPAAQYKFFLWIFSPLNVGVLKFYK